MKGYLIKLVRLPIIVSVLVFRIEGMRPKKEQVPLNPSDRLQTKWEGPNFSLSCSILRTLLKANEAEY